MTAMLLGRYLVERNWMFFGRNIVLFLSGVVEPVLYLAAVGMGLGALIADVPTVGGPVPYVAFVTPALLMNAAVTGAVMDATFNVYFKLKITRLYDGVLCTPLTPWSIVAGEIMWSMIRAVSYGGLFLLVAVAFGYVQSWWAVLAVPASALAGLGVAAVGLYGTTFMRSWQDFDFIQVALLPMFLLSATFFPLSVYPQWAQPIVQATPMYQAVAMGRDLMLGNVGVHLVIPVVYFVVLTVVGAWLTSLRLHKMLLV